MTSRWLAAPCALDVERDLEQMPTEAPARGAEVPPREPTAPLQKALVDSPSGELSAATAAAEALKARRLEPLSAGRYGVHFTADSGFCELLERVRGLAGHRLPNGDLMTLIKRGLEAYERELTKERFALDRKPRRSGGAAPGSSALSAADLSAPELPEPELSTSDPFSSIPNLLRDSSASARGHHPVFV